MLREESGREFKGFAEGPAELGMKAKLADREGNGIKRYFVAGDRQLVQGLLCSILLFTACNRHPQQFSEGIDEVQRVEQETVPPGGRLLQTPVMTRGTTSVHGDWQIQISSGKQEYFSWVRRQMGTEYHLISQTDSELVLGKTTPGDAYRLELTDGPSSSESVIRAHFTAGSD